MDIRMNELLKNSVNEMLQIFWWSFVGYRLDFQLVLAIKFSFGLLISQDLGREFLF